MRLIIWIAALARWSALRARCRRRAPPRRAVDASKRLLRFRGGSDVDDFMSKLKRTRRATRGRDCETECGADLLYHARGRLGDLATDQAGQEGDECCTWFLDLRGPDHPQARHCATLICLASSWQPWPGRLVEMAMDGRRQQRCSAGGTGDDAPVLKLKGLREVAVPSATNSSTP